MDQLLRDAAERAIQYLLTLPARSVVPSADDLAALSVLDDEQLPEQGCTPSDVLAWLDNSGSPATVASAGGRYFGFVTGSTLPVALAANWLAGAWDQNGALRVMSPISARLEDIVLQWLRSLFQLPDSAGAGFVTGATMANFTCLAAARHVLLARQGWNVEEQGLFHAPELTIVVSDEVHVSLLKALALLGLGRSRVQRVPTDAQGRMRAEQLPPLNDKTIVCIQAGNVNSGAFDPAEEICFRTREAGAWVHVDGAFGMWAAVAPKRTHLTRGIAMADSWATDCHKWLNVPYDSGLALIRDAAQLRPAMAMTAAYLETESAREPCDYTPESSRRARAVEVWAALRSLGRQGLASMIERNCCLAARMADALAAAGYAVLNDVVLNQVLVSFGDSAKTKRVITEIQREGTCWCGGTVWHGQSAMRISVSSWATTEADVDLSAAAIVRISRGLDG